MHDYLIKGTTIVDGLAGQPYTGDIAVKDGKIAELGRVSGSAKEIIDADGAHRLQ